MLFNKVTLFTAAAALSKLALGQGETPEGQTKVHIVQVGDTEGNLRFYPEELQALPGEMVQFHFYPRNHSVAQSTFADPCIPISESESGNGTQGFFSGFMPVEPESDVMPTFTIPVVDDKPIWFYCATGPHCQNGMSGVINPPANNAERTLAKYKEAAAESTTEVPDEEGGGEESTTTPGANGTIPSGPNPSSGPDDSDGAASSLHMSGFTVVLGALAAAFFLV